MKKREAKHKGRKNIFFRLFFYALFSCIYTSKYYR